MCGLHGIITSKRELNADDYIRSAFVANTLRGVDSSGIAQVDIKNNEYDYQKLPVAGYHFIGDRVAERLIKNAGDVDTITMCHVRAATVGTVSISNAHPFVCEGLPDGRAVIGTHNGTLSGWASHKTAKYYSVDSEWAINHIADEGAEAFKDFRGSYCFVWWDSENKSVLNIARNKERPMYVAMLESGGMAYASEAGMLFWLLERHRVKMKGKLLELQAGYWYKFDVNDVTNFTKEKIEEPAVVQYNNNSNRSGYYSGYYADSAMSRVKALISRVKAAATQPAKTSGTNIVPINTSKSAKVSVAEYNAAKNLNLVGQMVHFTPVMEWADGVEGVAEVMNTELTATVRGYDGSYDSSESWECKIIGLVDDGQDMTLILDFPKVKKAEPVLH